MHRFYVVHSFKSFHRHVSCMCVCVCVLVTLLLTKRGCILQLVATSALFLAAKSEEQPRKLQYVAQASYACMHKDQPMLDVQSQVWGPLLLVLVSFTVCFDNCWQTYTKWVEDITYYELLLLETLGGL